jgi:hypothetical protein
MFAIFRLSSGLNGLGDLEVLLLFDRSDPEAGENCCIDQLGSRAWTVHTNIAFCFREVSTEVVTIVFSH